MGVGNAMAAQSTFAAQCERSFQNTAVEVTSRTSMRPSLVEPFFKSSNSPFRDSLSQIAAAIQSLRPSKTITDTVVYPFSGFDLSTPLALFPHSKTFILIDRNSVIEERLLDKITQKKLKIFGGDQNKPWVYWRETNQDVFNNLLKSIFSISPESRITKIEFITSTDHRVSLELKFLDGRDSVEKTVHYWSGKITDLPVEMVYEVVKEPNVRNWWEEKLVELAPRTILLKGSHSLFRLTSYEDSPSRRMLLRPILSHGGLIVEGASKQNGDGDLDWTKKQNSGLMRQRNRWELTDGDPQFSSPIREHTIDGIDFSYARQVRISIHGPAN